MSQITFLACDLVAIPFYNSVPEVLNVTPIGENTIVIFEGNDTIMSIAHSQFSNGYESFWSDSEAYQRYLGLLTY